ncbi:M28 family peptidase [uncultured Clostridium sp.]|uniref:M28 family peptidase n=1 Tax=uncultured Clostridium sp. TaxID=59620 RepID=UPI0028EE51C0|nr:M28 family peptidase [uncultured Clostridium sp.]
MGQFLEDLKNNITKTYGIRFFPKQKKRFLKYVGDELKKLGLEYTVIKGNLVVGNVDGAETIFTAHYDTPGIMPHWINYIMKLSGHTRQISMVILIFVIISILNYFNLNFINNILFLWFITILIPNRNNYNDNSSGIVTLLNIANEICNNDDYKHKKHKIALVLFNNEEWGLLGSAYMKKYWTSNEVLLENKKNINIDCIGTGDNVMITHGKNEELAGSIERALIESGKGKEVIKYKYKLIPLSDEYNFRRYNISGIIFCNKALIPGGYYIPLVHSYKDKVLDLENVVWLTEELLKVV